LSVVGSHPLLLEAWEMTPLTQVMFDSVQCIMEYLGIDNSSMV